MFLSGQMIIPVDAGAPNNAGAVDGNTTAVKQFRSRGNLHAYISAQSFKRMMRDTMERVFAQETSPIERNGKGDKQSAKTAGDPASFIDDDLFGYMHAAEKAKGGTTIRYAPYSQGTLRSVAPVRITKDFGVMTRGEGDPVIHAHEFYSADLVAPFLIDVAAIGTFTISEESGRHNFLSSEELRLMEMGAEKIEWRGLTALRLPIEERRRRLGLLLRTFAYVSGGASNSLHYFDKSPAMMLMVPMSGGVNPFGNIFEATDKGELNIRPDVLIEELGVWDAEVDAPIVIGWRPGWSEALKDRAETVLGDNDKVRLGHPKAVFENLAGELENGEYDHWLI